jgi:citrate lyase subunit beta / citryl-CoA lyase
MWRSLLYVPANQERFIASAHMRGADCIQLDLEDSVPFEHKDEARAKVAQAAARVRRGGADVMVRINRPLSLAVRDIEACVGPDVDGFSLPKVESASHVQLLDELVSEVELKRGLEVGRSSFIAIVESAAAMFDILAIARASRRLVALNLGGEDFALDCGMRPTADALHFPKQQIVHAASAARLAPLGVLGSIAGFKDEAAFLAMVQRSKEFGFVGASAIHPSQVPILNKVFSPTDDEIAEARRVITALEVAASDGRGAAALDGRMIDAPIAARARKTLARRAAIDERIRITKALGVR